MITRIAFPVILLFSLTLLFNACTPAGGESGYSNIAVNELTCEYRRDPLGIDVLQPHLGWSLQSDEYQRSQSAYRILVASSPEKLQADEGDLWDSGKVKSGQSIQIDYSGAPLASRQSCYWKVMIWDEADQPTTWSEPAHWEMALLEVQDWQAHWIEAPRIFDWDVFRGAVNRVRRTAPKPSWEVAPYLRKSFETTAEIRNARVYISGLGYYELYLNGEKVGDHVLDPTFTHYDSRVYYVTYDVTHELQQGNNAVGVLLGNGWYNVVSRAVWGFDHAPWKDRPTCILQLEITYEDGSRQIVTTDQSWKAAPSPIIYNDIRQGEKYDATQEIPGWSEPQFNDSDWAAARVESGPKGKLQAQAIEANKVMREIQPVSVKRLQDGRYVVDLGQNIAGRIRISMEGDSGQVIRMKFAELLHEDGSVDQSNIDRHHREPEFQVAEYTLKGGGPETWSPRFTYYGFQYVEIENYPGELTPADITGEVIHTSFDRAGHFASSNELINQIYRASDWSYISNFLGYPTDCPQREKNGWTGDAHLSAETGLLLYQAHSAYTKWLDDCRDAQLPSGQLPGIVPTAGWGYQIGDWVPYGFGPAWDGAYLWVAWYLYLYAADVSILERHYEPLKASVDFFSGHAKDHLLDIGLGDWVYVDTYAPVRLTSTACYYGLCSRLADIAALLNKEEDAHRYRQLAQEIRQAFNTTFYDPAAHTYHKGEQTSLAAALYFDLVPDGAAPQVAATLARVIRENDKLLDCGVLGAKWIPHALSDHGYEQLAFDVLTDTRYPGWGYWIANGATTLWEDFDINSSDNSHNHTFFGDIVHWYFKTLAGIRPDPAKPGFKHFYIQPFFPTALDSVAATHTSLYGEIVSRWKKTGQEVTMQLQIPANTSCSVIVPGDDILINGQRAEQNELVLDRQAKGQFDAFTLGSGIYEIRFTSSQRRI